MHIKVFIFPFVYVIIQSSTAKQLLMINRAGGIVRMDKYTLDLKEAAALAGVCVTTMRNWVKQDSFPALRAGNKWIIVREQFLEWMKEQASARAVIRNDGQQDPTARA